LPGLQETIGCNHHFSCCSM